MNSLELALLEKAFATEIDAALNHTPRVIQTKSVKLADKLVADGLLRKSEEIYGVHLPVRLKGYELTEAGRRAYCMTC